MSYDAILFDLDNTLYDYDAYWSARLRLALEPFAPDMIDVDKAIEAAMAGHIYGGHWEEFLRAAGVSDVALIEESLARYRENDFSQITLFAGCAELMATLRRHYRLALVTNGPVFSQRPKIAHLGLEQQMDLLIISEEVGVAKPDPAIFRIALERLGATPERALFVGDSLEHDLRGAYAAGLAFVWMNTRGCPLPPGEPQPRAIISSITDLANLLTSDE